MFVRFAPLLLALVFFVSVPFAARSAPDSPAGAWTFDDGTGTAAADAAGANPGALQGDAAWTTDAKVGSHALSLSGKGNVDVPQSVIDTTKSYTVSAWVKLKQTTGFQTFVSVDGNSVSGFFLQMRDSGNFALTLLTADSPSAAVVASSINPVEPDTWYHLVGVHDAAAQTISLYVNGVLQETVPCTTAWQAKGHLEIGRGKYEGNLVDFVNGEIDDVHVYQSVHIDQAELARIAQEMPAPQPTLTIDNTKPGVPISPLLYGLMIEDISHSIDGGLYGELIRNRAFKDDPTKPAFWSLVPATARARLPSTRRSPSSTRS